MNFLTVVAPAYNEESLIAEFIKEVTLQIEKITQDYEVIVIDDGSIDLTWNEIAKECRLNKKIKGIKLSRNFGHHYAITAGLFASKGQWTVVMDSDLQDRPEVIGDLLRKAQEGFDVVFVNRIERPETLVYKMFQRMFYFILNLLSGLDFDSRQANFSIISEKVVRAFKLLPENGRFYGSSIKWLGFEKTAIDAKHGNRLSGKPSYTIRKRIKLATEIILSFSERPLIFSVILGILVSLSALCLTVFVIFKSISDGFEVTGWASLTVSILFTSGSILTMIGLLGIYVGRIYTEVKSRPLFIISERKNLADLD
jgi:glycosyltransferase involved in cell wall biosynthesis